MNEEKLKAALFQKKILFVDDNVLSIHFRMQALKKAGATAQSQPSLAGAYAHFEKLRKDKGSFYDLVVIDLNMPPIPEGLKKYERMLGEVTSNYGQTLGLYLDNRLPQQCYVYLTAVVVAFNLDVPQGPGCKAVLDKFEPNLGDAGFPEQLVALMGWG